ncbi:MAG: sulfatase-like hydrolase/transferase [Thermoanaerobaculia bacterium]
MEPPDPRARPLRGADPATKAAEPYWVRFLHLAALTALALAQPLYGLLGTAPEFFVAHGSTRGDILLLVALVSLGVPCLGTALESLIGLAWPRVAVALHGALVTMLFALLVLGAIRNLPGFGSSAILAAALAAAVACGLLYQHSAKLRSFMTFLAVTLVVFPALFLLRSPVSALMREPAPQIDTTVRSDSKTPVVFILFDELPLSSLLGSDGTINDELYPSFASLARTADWFPNATTVASGTVLAVPAMLTGRYPEGQASRTLPNSLFTLISTSHELLASEQSWSHCPEGLCSDPFENAGSRSRLGLLLADVTVLYQHLLTPAPAQPNLPPIDLAWRDFRDAGKDPPPRTDTIALIDRFVASIDRDRQPALHYFHPNFPHMPWKYLPSGREYGPLGIRYRPFGLPHRRWSSEEHFTVQGWQRHLLQVDLADRTLGRILEKLRSERLFEEALVIVCSDHGASFVPGEHYRRGSLAGPNAADILSVPLLIKLPGQTVGRVRDEQVETVDILPTIAELLRIELPWPVDGRSLLAENTMNRDVKTAFARDPFRQVSYPVEELRIDGTVERKVAIFGESIEGLFSFGALKSLIDRPAHEFERRPAAGVTAVLHGEPEYEDVAPESGYVPAFIVGRLLQEQPLSADIELAVAVNGTIRAGARLTPTAKGEGRFSALVPERALVPGRNQIDVYVVERNSSGLTLARAARPESETFVLADTRIQSSSGHSWVLDAGSLRGTVEQKNWELLGWAADRPKLQPAERILMFVDGEYMISAQIREPSPKLGEQHGPKLANSGFRFMIPFSRIPRNASVRLFALAGDSAAELRYGKTFQLGSAGRSTEGPGGGA